VADASRTDARVDVVVVTRDTRELTLRCLSAALAEAERSEADVRCVVVDNGSQDGTTEALAGLTGPITVVANPADVGYARACNLGAAAGDAALILFLNSDVFAEPGSLQRLVDFLAGEPGHVAAAGQLVDPGTHRPQVGFAVRGFPTLASQVALLLGLERFWPTNPVSRRQLMLDFDYGRTQTVEGQPAGACLLVRRADFDAIGGFDEQFHYWFEDVDFVLRLRQRGLIGYVHDAVFEHVGGATFSRWSRAEVIVTRYRSLLLFFAKHESRSGLATLRAVVAVLALVRWLGLALFSPARSRAYRTVLGLALRGPD
jgi:hypothetical protein